MARSWTHLAPLAIGSAIQGAFPPSAAPHPRAPPSLSVSFRKRFRISRGPTCHAQQSGTWGRLIQFQVNGKVASHPLSTLRWMIYLAPGNRMPVSSAAQPGPQSTLPPSITHSHYRWLHISITTCLCISNLLLPPSLTRIIRRPFPCQVL